MAVDTIQVVELARALDKLPLQVFLYGIDARDFPMEKKSSEKIHSHLPQIIQKISNDL